MTCGIYTNLMTKKYYSIKVWSHDRTLIQQVNMQGEDEAIRFECNELLSNISNASKVTYEILSQTEPTAD